jgi:hypothetical protein
MKKYILLLINLFTIINSFNYSLDDFNIIIIPITNYNIKNNTYYKNEIIIKDLTLHDYFIYNFIYFLI